MKAELKLSFDLLGSKGTCIKDLWANPKGDRIDGGR